MKHATKHWVCEKVKDFLIIDAKLGAKELQKKLKEHHKVHVPYNRELALKHLYGDWENSFDNLYRFKAQIEGCCPGSLVIIDHHTINGKIRFRRFFFCIKAVGRWVPKWLQTIYCNRWHILDMKVQGAIG